MDSACQFHLPVELFSQIIDEVASDKSSLYRTLSTLKSCRPVCRTLDAIVTPHIYRQIPFNGPHSFAKFLNELRASPERGRLVRTLDFSAFTSIGLGRSQSCNTRILLLTATTLNECLLLCPNVEEVFLSGALEQDIDLEVLVTLFTRLPHLKALDFCAADSPEFCSAFDAFIHNHSDWTSTLQNFSLHNCSTLSSATFELLLPHFSNLRRLDLCKTEVTATALLSLPETCHLTTLNLSQCTRLSAAFFLKFVSSHGSSRTLKRLNMLYSWNREHPFSSSPQALDAFLQCLPRDLQVLDLAGLEIDLQHLQYMPTSLIELGVHDIDVAISALTDGVSYNETPAAPYQPILPNLQYLLLTQNIVSSEVKFASILTSLFPRLSIIESPGLKRLQNINSVSYSKIDGLGHRHWIHRLGTQANDVESSNSQWHPRKSNMSLTYGVPRGIYDYYSYRFEL